MRQRTSTRNPCPGRRDRAFEPLARMRRLIRWLRGTGRERDNASWSREGIATVRVGAQGSLGRPVCNFHDRLVGGAVVHRHAACTLAVCLVHWNTSSANFTARQMIIPHSAMLI